MIILIDGYNVLKGVLYPERVSERERDFFIGQLNRYTGKKNHTIIVVFDAGPHEWVHTQRIGRVKVVYSGLDESADDYIKRFLDNEQEYELLLVSTDRALCHFASKRDIVTIDSQDFYALLQDALHDNKPQYSQQGSEFVKLTDDENELVDSLMMEASYTVPIKNEDALSSIKNKVVRGKTASKRDKKLMHILKKL